MIIDPPSRLKRFIFKGETDNREELHFSHNTAFDRKIWLKLDCDSGINTLELHQKDTDDVRNFLNETFPANTKKPRTDIGRLEIIDADTEGKFYLFYDNMGDPFSEGIRFMVDQKNYKTTCFIASSDAIKIKDILNQLYNG